MSEIWRPTLKQGAGLFLLAVAGLWCASLAISAVGNAAVQPEFWGTMLYYLLFLLLPLAALAGGDEARLLSLRLDPPEPPRTLRMLWLAFLCLLLVEYLGELWYALLMALGLTPHGNLSGISGMPAWMQAVSTCLLAPLCEELLFRGAMLSAWQRRGNGRALLLTSVLFALMHGSLSLLPAVLALGAILGYVALRTHSVWNSAILHMGYNGLTLILVTLSERLLPEAEMEEAALAEAVSIPGALVSLCLVAALIALNLRRLPLSKAAAPAPARERLTAGPLLALLLGASLMAVLMVFDAAQMAAP